MSTSNAAATDIGPVDVVSDRVLVGVQVVDISRLSTHPIPMISRGLVTVAGQGPKDSNGAGKSSLIAAISLLHADEQWRLAGGASDAAEMLFTAQVAAQEGRWSNADRGYVIGVFADPAAATLEQLSASCVSVWLRINRAASHLHLRWREGLYVPYGMTESERAAGVDALWDALPRSNGRTDFHANRLSTVLYGGHVRCVSFLSTSVRASAAANLLAQPLNDLKPDRIFDAIATLTGIDRDLEHEQALRSAEHAHRTTAREAESELQRWEEEMAVVEAGIAQRIEARDLLSAAQHAWRCRCARNLIDGIARANDIRGEIREIDNRTQELQHQRDAINQDLSNLTDDEHFRRHYDEAKFHWTRLDEEDRKLQRAHDADVSKLQDLHTTLRHLNNKARAADGRTVGQAEQEEHSANVAWGEALKAKGRAEEVEEKARDQLRAAESGEDVAAHELERLRSAGIDSAVLLDVIQLGPNQRREWEPRLVPYQDAVVIPRSHADQARLALEDRPGTVLVLADDPDTSPAPGGDNMPGHADTRFDLTAFLAVLAKRADGGEPSDIDPTAGIVVMGEFSEPLTGRATRITAARSLHEETVAALNSANEHADAAHLAHGRAKQRTEAARAALEANSIEEKIAGIRRANQEREERREELKPRLEKALATYHEALGADKSRQERIENLRASKRRIDGEITAKDATKARLEEEHLALDLPDREADWGDTPQSAERFLLALDDELQTRTTSEWNDEACFRTDEVARRCFPGDTPAEEMPAEIRELLIEQRWKRGGLETRVRLVPALTRALRTHLSRTEQEDLHQQQQIATQRAQRTKDLDAARQGLREAEQTTHVHRASVAQGIKAQLKKVSDEFDRLDQLYGGYGAGLDYPEPEPPSEPDRPWRWTVTPKWRRDEGKRMSAYNLRGNTAQMDEKAVKLVCAAALAGGGNRPLLLVLDELGRNLGKQHRREAVALFEQIGTDRNITVIGALQDDMERYAIEASGLYVKLRRRSDSMAYNEAPVLVGDDTNHDRVELLRNWLTSYRPPELTDKPDEDVA